MNNALRTLTAVGPLVLLTAACSGTPADSADTAAPADPSPSTAPISSVLFIGDSIAVGQSLPLTAAFEQSTVAFESLAAEGGGNVVGPFSDEQWETLPEQIESASPDVVLYQITTYDWGTREEQSQGYERLVETVTDAEAELVVLTAPPIRPDDFYEPHVDDLERAPQVARDVARDSAGQATVLDAGDVWGQEYAQEREGLADRHPDGIHTCPQGAARFTDWLLDELAGLYPGFTPPAAETWAEGDWAADDHFSAC
ncbi:GDSL-like lipase/acylhydrolase family protein [Nocardiopsis sp. Huas11]|uniref:SGNH/GDSL hydrolase family protein n=1 Tax=Nocardiopsis sp. Huas11 TaxID=2183912 RepID=UPI000EAE4BD7|nr:SGNH/GDSL hydrolase family protein [Nocardiopsis sp. Huas11]RKS09283.1 GDSL-like lipase/acylhydrolase family protein [Nocardiopsis sp. Huas11]